MKMALSIKQFSCYLFFVLCSLYSRGQIRYSELPPLNKAADLKPATLERSIKAGIALLPRHADSGITLLYRGLYRSIRTGYRGGIDSSLKHMAHYWYKNGIADKHYSLVEKSIQLAESLEDKDENVALLYYTSGDYHLGKGLYAHALVLLQKALETLPEEGKERVTEATRTLIYNKIGAVWILLKEPGQAMFWWDKAEKIARKQSDMHRLIGVLRNKGTFYYEMGQLDTSYTILTEAYNLGKKDPEIHTHCGCVRQTVSALCMTLLSQNKVAEALAYLDEDIRYETTELARQQQQGQVSGDLGNSLLHLHFLKAYALFLQKKYLAAEQILLPALSAARDKRSQPTERNIIGLLSMLYGTTRNYKEAYKYLNEFNELGKRTEKDQKGSAVDFHIQYLKSEKEKEIAQKQLLLSRQQAQIKNRNILITGSLSTIVLLCLLFGMIYYHIRRRQRLEQELVQVKAIMQGEEKERSRLAHELHDGIVIQFSAVKMNLSTLPNKYIDLANSEEYRGILKSLDDATRDLRKTAHHLMPDMLLEEGLAGATYYFCNTLMQHTKLDITFQHYGQIPRMDPEFELSLYRIIQELVQNIIKHAQASQAMVQLSYLEEQLNITIEDDGCGFDLTSPEDHQGMGLRSIRARAKALKGHIDLQSREGKGTMVYLEFPCTGLQKSLGTKNSLTGSIT